MRICVFGAGAIGGNYATRLAAAGNEVSVVARGPHLEAIRAKGLTLLTGDKTIVARVAASDRPADLGPQDVVISTLKASSLSAIADTVTPLLGPETPVVFAQNGIPWWYGHGLGSDRPKAPGLSRLDPGGALQKVVGYERTLGGVITSSNHVIEPGVVRNISPERNVLWVGEPDDRQTPRILKLRETLITAGISSPSTTDIRYDIWHKLMANLTGSTLCLILREPTTIQATPMVNRLARRAHAEALAVAAAHGRRLGHQQLIKMEPLLPRPGRKGWCTQCTHLLISARCDHEGARKRATCPLLLFQKCKSHSQARFGINRPTAIDATIA